MENQIDQLKDIIVFVYNTIIQDESTKETIISKMNQIKVHTLEV